MEFEINLSLVLSHSLVLESKMTGIAWGNSALNCCGDPPAPTASESTAEMLRGYTEGLPGFMEVTRQQTMPTALNALDVAKAVSPGYSQLQADLYNTYGKQMNQIGQEIAASNAQAQAASDLAVLQGTGKDVIKAGVEAQKLADPEYYATRANMAKALGELMNGGLTGGETEAIQRSLNQNAEAAGLTTPSAARTVAEAQTFGGAARDRLSQALNQATQALPAMKSGVDAFQQATGRSTMANTGDTKFTGAKDDESYGSSAQQMGQSLLGELGANNRTAMGINANRRDSLDRSMQVAESVIGGVNGMAGVCCFIFMEAYNGTMPSYVRVARDMYWTEQRRKGYVWMSKWLVPAMKRSKVARWLVNKLMIKPLSDDAEALVLGLKPRRLAYHHFWMTVWNLIGKVV